MGRRIRSRPVTRGLNFDKGKWHDDSFMRCSRCGWLCNLDRDVHYNSGDHVGWGIDYTPLVVHYDTLALNYDSDFPYDGPVVEEPIVTAGCPQCGTFLYNK